MELGIRRVCRPWRRHGCLNLVFDIGDLAKHQLIHIQSLSSTTMSVEAPRSSTRSSPNVPPIDLRHMTSATVLAPLAPGDNRRASQHLQPNARIGSRSPSSIPSSPTSVHSSSSAIFERDIEPVLHLSSPSLPNATSPARPKDPHRTARSKHTEALEQSVPSVLDSAAAVLASLGPSLEDGDAVAVTAPAPHPSSSSASALFGDQGLGSGTVRSRSTGTGSGFVSPIGSFRSRSPSPSPRSGAGAGGGAGAGNRNSLLLNIPSPAGAPTPATSPVSASASAPPTARQFDGPAAASAPPDANASANAPHATRTSSASASVNKRLSFVSYADLLSSTPTATQPLSALTSPAGSPAHITGVDPAFSPSPGGASASAGGSGAPSLRNFIFGAGAGAGGEDDRMMDDVGGEWEREGLGRGLEERLE
ncbi:hypothetical protein DFH08DRAFT_1077231, partial [Mycena albidolilacea]